MHKLIFFLFFIEFVINNYEIYSAQIILNGRIIEENTQKPIGVNIELRDENGKKNKSQSNSLTGEFQFVVESNKTYNVILNSDEILRRDFKFKTLDTNTYAEQTVEWYVFKPKIGNRIFKGNIFKINTWQLTNEGEEILEEIKMTLRFNRNLFVNFNISAENIITDKKGKKTIKTDEKLLEQRKNVLISIVDTWTKEKNRIRINESNDNNYDFIVQISDLKNYLD